MVRKCRIQVPGIAAFDSRVILIGKLKSDKALRLIIDNSSKTLDQFETKIFDLIDKIASIKGRVTRTKKRMRGNIGSVKRRTVDESRLNGVDYFLRIGS